jgi:hypothetical protein
MATQYAFGKIVTGGLVLALDAADKNSYPGSGTTWRDISGNNYIGTLLNGPTFSTANGGSLTFDGTDDYVSIPNSTSFSNFTAEVIIYPTAYPGNAAAAISTEYPGTNSTVNFAIGFNVSTWFGGFFNASSGGWHQIDVSLPPLNVYSYYTLTYNGTQMLFYKGGSIIGTFNTTDIAAGGNPIRIGRRWDLGDYFPGRIDISRVYNRALSQGEILQNYNAQKSRFNI